MQRQCSHLHLPPLHTKKYPHLTFVKLQTQLDSNKVAQIERAIDSIGNINRIIRFPDDSVDCSILFRILSRTSSNLLDEQDAIRLVQKLISKGVSFADYPTESQPTHCRGLDSSIDKKAIIQELIKQNKQNLMQIILNYFGADIKLLFKEYEFIKIIQKSYPKEIQVYKAQQLRQIPQKTCQTKACRFPII